MMEEIITKERAGEAATDKIIFPELEAVVLESLPNLASFYSGCGILEIPSLKEISIDNCPHMKPFISSIIREHEPDSMDKGKEPRSGKGDRDITTASLLNHKVAFANLKKLRVNWNDVMEVIWHGQFQVELLCKLSVLELVRFPNDCVDFPSCILQKFTNLEELVVSEASFEEIVLHEKTNIGEKHTRVLAKLKALELSKLPNLVHLSMADSQPCPVFQNLEHLKVVECGKLKTLVPSSISFQCLVELEVSSCHGLVNLLTSSAAKHLVQLEKMTITECKMIEEIIASEENEAENEVIFQKLEYLTLDNLPSLKSFNLGDCTFTFPSLKCVYIKACHKMNFFSRGVISTPKLKSVRPTLFSDEEYWEGNLDATIQQMFIEMGDGAAKSNLPSLPNQQTLASDCEPSRADRNGPAAPSEQQASEDFNVTRTSDTPENLLPAVETTVGTKVNRIKGILEEPEITQLASRHRDFCAASNYEEDTTQRQNSSNPMDSETQISSQVQTDSNEPPQSLGQVDSLPQATAVGQVALSTAAFPTKTVATQELTSCTSSEVASRTPSIPLLEECYSPAIFVGESSNSSKDPLNETTEHFRENQATKSAMTEYGTTEIFQNYLATSNDNEDPTRAQKFQAPVDIDTQNSLQVQKVLQASEKSHTSSSASPGNLTFRELAFGTAPHPTSETPSIPTTEWSSLPAAKLESPPASMEQLIQASPAPSIQLASSSSTHVESHKSCGASVETYNYSLDFIKELLMKSPAEVAVSADRLFLLSSLKSLRNCPPLNPQQLDIIQFYIENFNTLVTNHPFDEKKIDWTSTIKTDIEDQKREIAELEISDEDLTSKFSTLNAEKKELNKRLREIEEEEDHIRANKESLHDKVVTRKGKLEMQVHALVEAERHQRETGDMARHVNDNWAKFRSLFP